MKGFRKTGNGPKSGFSFPSKAGFGPSSGKVRSVSAYSRKVPKRKAIGGLVKDNIVDTPGGPADFAKGGKASVAKKVLGAQATKAELRALQGKRKYEMSDFDKPIRGVPGIVGYLGKKPKIGK